MNLLRRFILSGSEQYGVKNIASGTKLTEKCDNIIPSSSYKQFTICIYHHTINKIILFDKFSKTNNKICYFKNELQYKLRKCING